MLTAARIHCVSKSLTTAARKIAAAWLAITLFSCALVSAQEQPLRDAFPHDDFLIREELIPMRDGVKLYTLILTPKQDTGPLPVILKRTPYDASGALGDRVTSRLDVKLESEFLGHDYIYVFQDIRGRFKSEGDYFMYRAPRGAFN